MPTGLGSDSSNVGMGAFLHPLLGLSSAGGEVKPPNQPLSHLAGSETVFASSCGWRDLRSLPLCQRGSSAFPPVRL